jgi:hypothetical protein
MPVATSSAQWPAVRTTFDDTTVPEQYSEPLETNASHGKVPNGAVVPPMMSRCTLSA